MAAPTRRDGFYLGGGTAVALHLGHRRSVDLDWFTACALPDPLQYAGRLRGEGLALMDVAAQRGTLHGQLDGIRVSFLEYRYPLLVQPVEAEGLGAQVAALEDLAAMKLAAVAQRGARRDFIDVHALAALFPLQEMLAFYRRKYATEDVAHVLYGLSWFDDAEQEAMPAMLRPTRWDAVKDDMRGWVRGLS
jgi:hypothetical protein